MRPTGKAQCSSDDHGNHSESLIARYSLLIADSGINLAHAFQW